MEFSDNYTQSVSDFYWGYSSPYLENCSNIKNQIENIPESITCEEFLKKLEKIRDEYRCSSGRYLMEYLRGLASKVYEDGSFDVRYSGNEYHFSGSGMNQILVMNQDEKKACIRLLTEISIDNSDDSRRDEAAWELLYRKGMLSDPEEPVLDRKEVLRIAHGLKFTFEMAEDYLVRATDNDCFDYNRSDDLIEMFCFIHPEANNYHAAEELKRKYAEHSESIERKNADEKPNQFTAMIEQNFKSLIGQWEINLDVPAEEQFMEWLLQKTPYLDRTSRTSGEIYSRMVYLADRIIHDETFMDDYEEESVYDIVMNFCTGGKLPEKMDPYKMQESILRCAANSFDNTRVKNKRLFGTLWRYITINEKGEIRTRAIGDVMPELLNGSKPVTKADLLFIIWFVCELLWSVTQEETDFYDQLSDFWTISEDLLEEARLPAFYAPHLLEQSMLMSICMGSDEKSPFEIYENICEELNPVKSRVRVSKSHAETEEQDTKKLRKLREAEIREEYKKGAIRWDEVETELLEHILNHGQEMGQYIFEKEGISLYPNPAIIITYKDTDQNRFDQNEPGYNDPERMDGRLEYLYSMYLYLRDACKKRGLKLKCRINYRKNCMIQVLDFERRS